MEIGPEAAVRRSWSPGDLKFLEAMTQVARDPGSLGVDELEVPGPPGAGRRKYTRNGHGRGPAHAHVSLRFLPGNAPDPVGWVGP